MPCPLDLQDNLVKMPSSVRVTDSVTTPLPRILYRKHWPEVVQPKLDSFMTDINTSFMKKIFNIAKRK